jgi:hypothetical protein
LINPENIVPQPLADAAPALNTLPTDALAIAISILAIAVVILLGTYFSRMGDRDWRSYAASHHCVPARPGENVAVSGYIPGQTVYVCDGGTIHFK